MACGVFGADLLYGLMSGEARHDLLAACEHHQAAGDYLEWSCPEYADWGVAKAAGAAIILLWLAAYSAFCCLAGFTNRPARPGARQ